MENLKLNETPVRTSKNFRINNIKLQNIEIPKQISDFKKIKVVNNSSKIKITTKENDVKLKYGLSKKLTNEANKNTNQNLKIEIDEITNKELRMDFAFDNVNSNLIGNIEIVANENTQSNVILQFLSDDNYIHYNNSIIRLYAKKNAKVNIIIVNLLNQYSNNFFSIENSFEKNAKVNYTIVDFGGKNSISNYYSNIEGEGASNLLNVIYLGNRNQLFDLNYIAELKGEKTNVNIEVQGALTDKAQKHFKGTIDFKKGAKRAKGNENESCMLLSNQSKSLALPMLLCSEEDVEGNHSSSSGKIGEKELFYIMSRGFNLKEAMKLMVKAKFNNILTNINNDDLKSEILKEIDIKLN